MKKSQKILALLMSIVMLVGVLPAGIFAADPVEETDMTEYDNAVGKNVFFPKADVTFYKKANLTAQSVTVRAADTPYIDAKVSSYSVDKDGNVWYRISGKCLNSAVNVNSHSYILADAVGVTDDPNPIASVSGSVNGQPVTVVGRMPKGTTLSVAPADTEQYEDALNGIAVILSGYDISLISGGAEWEPLSPVSVTIGNFYADAPVRVFHAVNDEGEEPEFLSACDIVYDAVAHTLSFTATGFSDYLALTDGDIISILNEYRYSLSITTYDNKGNASTEEKSVGLPVYPCQMYIPSVKNNYVKMTGSYLYHDLSINGSIFTNYFYYLEVAENVKDENGDPLFYDGPSYAHYLCEVYRDAYDAEYEKQLDDGASADAAAAAAQDAAIEKTMEVFDYYVYDLFDPEYNVMNVTHYTFPGGNSLGDPGLYFPKSENNYSSYHGIDPNTEKIQALTHDHYEDGIDYSSFVSGVGKTATAKAPGDENKERKYDILVDADIQASEKTPVVLILQVQSSWQLFDKSHANALYSSYCKDIVGAVSHNEEVGTLYDVKHALLDLVDYFDEKYPGHNLVLGITEVKHDQSTSMFANGVDGVSFYVTNNYDYLKSGITNMDIFGNCEHVHYDSDALKSAVLDLRTNLAGWKDSNDVQINYDRIRKAVVLIGGATENSSGSDGYGNVLPWGTFQSSGINSVYAIRTNSGETSNVKSGTYAGVTSWLDIPGNNSGAAYVLGDTDTHNYNGKYIATNQQAIFDALLAIAETEMNQQKMPLGDADDYIENFTLTDTVSREFEIDDKGPQAKQVTARLYDSEGTLINESVYAPADPNWTRTVNADGSVTISYCFAGIEKTIVFLDGTSRTVRQVFNGSHAELEIPVKAKEDFIGSNKVFTNVSKPTADYEHTRINYTAEAQPQPMSVDEVLPYSTMSADTPQVNVPILFDVRKGGDTTVWQGDTADLAELDSNKIISGIKQKLEAGSDEPGSGYEQINGTVTLKWTLSDGREYTVGNISVVNGVYGELPDLEWVVPFEELGKYEGHLHITFTPGTTNGGHYSDANTAVPVNALEKSGKVEITVIRNDTTKKYYVRKDWINELPWMVHDDLIVSYQLYANDEPYLDGEGNTVTGTLEEMNEWLSLHEGLPAAKEMNGTPVVLHYSVRELSVMKNGADVLGSYDVTYGTDIKCDQTWDAKAVGSISVTNSTNDDITPKEVVVKYTYQGNEYTVTKTLPQQLQTKIGKKGGTGTFTLDDYDILIPNYDGSAVTFTEAYVSNGDKNPKILNASDLSGLSVQSVKPSGAPDRAGELFITIDNYTNGDFNKDQMKNLSYNFTYNGVTYNDTVSLSLSANIQKGTSHVITRGECPDLYTQIGLLALDEEFEPYALTVNDIHVYKEIKNGSENNVTDGQYFTAKVDFASGSYVTKVDVLVIKNAPKPNEDRVVIDYGIPVDIDVLANDMITDKVIGVSGIGTECPEGNASTANQYTATSLNLTYGTAEIVEGKVRYTLSGMNMPASETFWYEVEYEGSEGSTCYYYIPVTVIPATIIYYEDDFVTFSDDWTVEGTELNRNQSEDRPGFDNTAVIDADNIYGYDPANNSFANTYSLGSAKSAKVTKNDTAAKYASFTFTGTAFDVLSLTDTTTGTIFVDVFEGDVDPFAGGTYSRTGLTTTWIVDTYYGYACEQQGFMLYHWTKAADGIWHAKTELVDEYVECEPITETSTHGETCEPNYIWTKNSSNKALYQIPVIKSPEMDYGTYTVVITVGYMDFFDHTGTGEYNFVLDAIRVYNPAKNDTTAKEAYKADGESDPDFIEIRDNLIENGFGSDGDVDGAVFLDGFGTVSLDDDDFGSAYQFKNFGPNNEVYLMKGQLVAFGVKTEKTVKSVHLGAKVLDGSATLKVNGKDITLTTATDMYYDITDCVMEDTKIGPIVITTGTADVVVSLTTLKITYEPEEEPLLLKAPARLYTSRPMLLAAVQAVENGCIDDIIVVPEPFAPEKLNVILNKKSVKVGDTVRVTVTTSSDVERLTLNGEALTAGKTNEKTGLTTWSGEVTVNSLNDLTFTVVAYGGEGTAKEGNETVRTVEVKKAGEKETVKAAVATPASVLAEIFG